MLHSKDCRDPFIRFEDGRCDNNERDISVIEVK